MITTTIFLIISIAAICLFIAGLAMVYYGHTLGFLANVLSLVIMWSMTALSAFGSVGDVNHYERYYWSCSDGVGFGNTTIQTITTLIDPALVYLSLFGSILCTVVLILILVRFVMDNINGKNPEMEDERE